jgi:hypothetical protein
VPKLTAELGGTGRTAAGVAGSTAVDRGAVGSIDRQTACFGTGGEDSVLVKRFIRDPSPSGKGELIASAALLGAPVSTLSGNATEKEQREEVARILASLPDGIRKKAADFGLDEGAINL